MEPLNKTDLKELLTKNWMTHDAMWFYHCFKECGIEKTNNINKAAVRSMAIIEIRRIKKAIAIDRVETFEGFKGWFDGLGIKYSVAPQVAGYMMHTDSKCFRDFKLKFL